MKFSSSKPITAEKKPKIPSMKDNLHHMNQSAKSNAVSVIKSSKHEIKKHEENNLLLEVLNKYSRIDELISNNCSWTDIKVSKLTDDKSHKEFLDDLKNIEITYHEAKNSFMFHNLMLMPNLSSQKSIVASHIEEQKKLEHIDLMNENKEKMKNYNARVHLLSNPTFDNMDISIFTQQPYNSHKKSSTKDQGITLVCVNRTD